MVASSSEDNTVRLWDISHRAIDAANERAKGRERALTEGREEKVFVPLS